MKTGLLVLVFGLAFTLAALSTSMQVADVTITLTGGPGHTHQTWRGFGGGQTRDFWDGASKPCRWWNEKFQREVAAAAFGQNTSAVWFDLAMFMTSPHEAANSGCSDFRTQRRQNDDDDPDTFNPEGFDWATFSDSVKAHVYDAITPLGFNGIVGGGFVSTHYADTWLDKLRLSNYNTFIREAGENAIAGLKHWRDAYGIVPEFAVPFNEPTTGNGEIVGATARTILDLVKEIGRRLDAEKLGSIKLVVPNEETEGASLNMAGVILNDPAARPYVGAIGFHSYPYNSPYNSIGRILSQSGMGKPDARSLALRASLKDLASRYGKEIWLTETCCGAYTSSHADIVRGRAIHIHDEMVYTDLNSYWAYGPATRSAASPNDDGAVVFDPARRRIEIRGLGRAIGHYSHWIRPGAIRIDASSSDDLVQVVAFSDVARGKLSMVLINNNKELKTIVVRLNQITLVGNIAGEQSTPSADWRPIAGFAPDDSTSFTIKIPGYSVTSYSAGATSGLPAGVPK